MGHWPENGNDISLGERLKQLDEIDEEVENCPLMRAGREAREYAEFRGNLQTVTSNSEPEQSQTQPISSEKGNSRARRLHRCAGQAKASGKLLKTKEGVFFAYGKSQGYFRLVTDPVAYLAKQFPEEVTAGLLVSDFKEIVERIAWKDGEVYSLDDFNYCPTKVNLINGVLDMETTLLQPHDPCYRFTYCIDAKYIEDSEEISCQEFDRFCKTSLDGDPNKRQLLLEFIGYSCLDTNAGKCAMFLKGQSHSGKSVILDFIVRLFDEELVTNIPLHELGDRFHRAELAAKKLNAAGEIAGKALRDISIFKSITGNDRIAGEFKGEDLFYFRPRCKLLFAGNTLPQATDTDTTAAFVNRLRVLLFNTSIEPKNQDKALPDKLWAERDSIVTLALQAAKQLAERNFEFTQPEDSKKFLASFELRGNVLGQFLEECCILAPEGRVFNKELYAAYTAFCEENGWRCESKQVFYDLLSGVPNVYAKRVRIEKENRQGHIGIKLKGTDTPGTLEQKR